MIRSGRQARYGEHSVAKVISAWPFPSSSGTTTYETQLHEDGVLTCNCPGWVQRRTRDCKHVKAKAYDAQQILDGKRKPVFERMDGNHVSPSVVVKEVIREVPKIVEKVVEKVVVKEVKVHAGESTVELRTGKRLLRAVAKEA